MKWFTLILFLVSLSWSQLLPKEYQLFSQFLRTKDVSLGFRVLEEYPDSVFVEDLKVLLAQELLKKGRKEESAKVLLTVNPKKLRPDLKTAFKDLWIQHRFDLKEGFIKDPTLFAEFASKVDLNEREAKSVFSELFNRRYYKTIVTLYEKKPYLNVCDIYGAALYKLKDRRALEVLRSCPKSNLRDEYIARAYFDLGDHISLQSFVGEASHTALLIGRLYLFRGNYLKALEFLEKAHDSYEKYFSLGITNYILQNYEKALENFKKSLLHSRSPQETAKSNFWISKSYQTLEMQEISTRYLLESSKGSGFYAVMAKAYLREPIVNKILSKLSSEDFPKTAGVIKAIHDSGFPYYARLEAFKRIGEITPSDIREISSFDVFLSIRLAVRKYGVNSEVYNMVAFPKPYASYVLFYSRKYNVDPNLVWAIMRQESLFDPMATSISNAKGLMQLIDKTARWIAKKEGIPLGDIYDIETNIQLGIAYIRYLMNYWNGDLIKVIASYNAGEGNVRSFLQHPDPYVFIETIPFYETRNYLQNVLYNYYVYSSLD